MKRETEPVETKAERTRKEILKAALELFEKRGFEATTMRQIADAAGTSVGLTYRYFSRKEELALALYEELAETLRERAKKIPKGGLATRFRAAMRIKLELVEPHRHAISALFAAMVRGDEAISIVGPATAGVRATVGEAFRIVVHGATDAPEAHHDELAGILQSVHLAVLLVWMLDRSAKAARTRAALEMAVVAIGAASPWLATPVGEAILRRVHRELAVMFEEG